MTKPQTFWSGQRKLIWALCALAASLSAGGSVGSSGPSAEISIAGSKVRSDGLRGELNAGLLAASSVWPGKSVNFAAVSRPGGSLSEEATVKAGLASSFANPAAMPFDASFESPADRVRAQSCLAAAVYYEAGSQGSEGQAAVAQVVLNRVRNSYFPNTICGVVFEGSTRATGCQFSFTCDGSLRRRPNADGWRQASAVASRALEGYVAADVGEATHFHTIWVSPYWRSKVVKLTRIGAHIFYRWPGVRGSPDAFHRRYLGAELEPAEISRLDPDPSSGLGSVRHNEPLVEATLASARLRSAVDP